MVLEAPVTPTQQSDQRLTERHPLSQYATVSLVGTAGQVLQGEIRNISKGGTQLHLDQPLAIGSLLKVEYDNNLILGEVIYCLPAQTLWVLGIRIEHVLSGLTALDDAMRGSR